jgi:GT2 family glycosyltransferase
LIIVDNTMRAVVPTDPQGARTVRATERRSSYHARNVGARMATNDWLLFIDADCRPPATLLDRYLDEAPDGSSGVVAGEVLGDPSQQARLARWARSRRGLLASHHQDGWPYPAGITGSLLIRRDAWSQLGGFDETVRSAADIELCWRAQELGWGFEYRPGARVEHRDPERPGTVLRQAWRYGAGRRWLRRRYGPSVPRPTLVRPLARTIGGVVVFTLTGRLERSLFKVIDGFTAGASWLGYAIGSNCASRR